MDFGQWAHFFGVIGNKGWLDVMMLTTATKYLVDEFSDTHTVVNFDFERTSGCSQRFLIHSTDIDTRIFFDGFKDWHPRVGSFKINRFLADFHCGAAMGI